MQDALIIVAAFVALAAYGLIAHRISVRRAAHEALVEERLKDGSWMTHELVRRKDGAYLLVSIVWEEDSSSFSRYRVMGTCQAVDAREALGKLGKGTGRHIRFLGMGVDRYIQLVRSSEYRTA